MEQKTTTEWITGCGGPLLLLSSEMLDEWFGVDPPPGGRTVEAEKRWIPDAPATDYDRACDVTETLANLTVGAGRAVVLGGEPNFTTVFSRDGEHVIVRWVQGDTEEAIFGFLERLLVQGEDDDEPGDEIALIEAHPGPLLLFDAAAPGGEVESERLEIPLHPGSYVVSASTHRDGEDVELVLIRFRRAD